MADETADKCLGRHAVYMMRFCETNPPVKLRCMNWLEIWGCESGMDCAGVQGTAIFEADKVGGVWYT